MQAGSILEDWAFLKGRFDTHGKEQIDNIHDAKDQVCYLGLVIAITRKDQHGRNNVVAEHMPVILSPFLDVYNENLLEPEGILNKYVPLAKTWNFSIWPICPEVLEIVPVIGLCEKVLICVSRKY